MKSDEAQATEFAASLGITLEPFQVELLRAISDDRGRDAIRFAIAGPVRRPARDAVRRGRGGARASVVIVDEAQELAE